MDFDEFWIRLVMKVGCNGNKFPVLTQISEFEAWMRESHAVIITLTSGEMAIASKKGVPKNMEHREA